MKKNYMYTYFVNNDIVNPFYLTSMLEDVREEVNTNVINDYIFLRDDYNQLFDAIKNSIGSITSDITFIQFTTQLSTYKIKRMCDAMNVKLMQIAALNFENIALCKSVLIAWTWFEMIRYVVRYGKATTYSKDSIKGNKPEEQV